MTERMSIVHKINIIAQEFVQYERSAPPSPIRQVQEIPKEASTSTRGDMEYK